MRNKRNCLNDKLFKLHFAVSGYISLMPTNYTLHFLHTSVLLIQHQIRLQGIGFFFQTSTWLERSWPRPAWGDGRCDNHFHATRQSRNLVLWWQPWQPLQPGGRQLLCGGGSPRRLKAAAKTLRFKASSSPRGDCHSIQVWSPTTIFIFTSWGGYEARPHGVLVSLWLWKPCMRQGWGQRGAPSAASQKVFATR